jgi:hypothetical protein
MKLIKVDNEIICIMVFMMGFAIEQTDKVILIGVRVSIHIQRNMLVADNLLYSH